MNWLGDMLFNAPQSSRSERARRTGNVGVSATSPDQEVSERIYRVVHNGRNRPEDREDAKQQATGGASDEDDDAGDDNGDEEDVQDEEEEEQGDEEEDESEEGDEVEQAPLTTRTTRSSYPGRAGGATKVVDTAKAAPAAASVAIATSLRQKEKEDEHESEEATDSEEEAVEEEDAEPSEDDSNMADLTVSELRERLADRELPTAGNKAELIARLQGAEEGVFGKSLKRSMQASMEASELFTLNERLHDILENETYKDKEVTRMKNQLKTLRAAHSEDLADLSFHDDVKAIRKQALVGAALITEATANEAKQLATAQSKQKKAMALEQQVDADNAAYRKELAESIARGDVAAAKISKLAAATAAASTKTQQVKAESVVADGWVALYETALEGIDSEHAKHDLQRDYMVEKLRTIIADVTDENSGQVAMMERHSRDIIEESKNNIGKTYETRSANLKEKYAKLRKLIETSHEMGDDALAKHQLFLQEHYRSNFEEKFGTLQAQADELESEVKALETEERDLSAQVATLSAEASANASELKERESANKKLQLDISELHGKIGTNRDAVLEAKLELEEAERLEKKMETDYEILMAENSHLTEEIDRFGEMVQRAEKGLSVPQKAPALSAIKEYETPRQSKGNSGESSSSKRKAAVADSSLPRSAKKTPKN